MTSRTISVETLARVEGEGRLRVAIEDGKVTDLQFSIFEPPRFFEALLRGRMFWDAPDITSRICGICPIAYMVSACQAMEDALGADIPPPIRDARRLIYCGEWLQSHGLHVFMLHLPDFLGLDDSLHLADTHPDMLRTALRLKKLGNTLLEVLGGRAVHPINVKVGGFWKLPGTTRVRALAGELDWAWEACLEGLEFLSGLEFPDVTQDPRVMVALRHPTDYPIAEGRLTGSNGLDIDLAAFPAHFVEHQVRRSNALHASLADGGMYQVGPLARYTLNHDRLAPAVRAAARRAGLAEAESNPFKVILVRCVEMLQAIHDARELVRRYETPARSAVDLTPRAGRGVGCTEAPRGICWHAYELNSDGTIATATIVPPTSQNQRAIEADLRTTVERHLDLDDAALQWRCEQAIRNFDPCISCATHFLNLEVERR